MRALRYLLILALFGTATVFAAGKKPGEFQAPNQMTEEELAEAKARSKNKLNGFDEKMEEKPKPFPWMLAGLVGISFLVATPFALRAFRGTSKEIAESTEALGVGREEAD
jgi:hypothetical protein